MNSLGGGRYNRMPTRHRIHLGWIFVGLTFFSWQVLQFTVFRVHPRREEQLYTILQREYPDGNIPAHILDQVQQLREMKENLSLHASLATPTPGQHTSVLYQDFDLQRLKEIRKSCSEERKHSPKQMTDNVKIHLHVRDKTILVDCGPDATQKTRWLANVGVARYDDNFGKSLGPPRGLQRESGKTCDLNARICDEFDLKEMRGTDLHAFVVLRDSEDATTGGGGAGGDGK